jgi:hypothetical protein
MSIENALAKVIEDAAKKVEAKSKAKPQPLDGGYRGQRWYQHIFSKMTADEAYPIVVANIKDKSFSHEPEIAIAEYQAAYGMEFKSPTARAMDTQKAEIERLKAENEALRIAALAKAGNVDKSAASETAFNPAPGLTEAEFKTVFYEWHDRTQGRKPTGVTLVAAWRKYNKANESTAV